MSFVFIATLGGLVAVVFWGFSDYLVGKGGQKADAYLSNFLIQCTGTAILLPIVLWQGNPIPLELTPHLFVIAISVLFTIGFISAIKAFAIGPFGIAAPIANTYPLITLALGIGFFGLVLSPYHLFALLIIIIGVFILAIDHTTFEFRKFRGSAVHLAMIAALFWGIGFGLYDAIVHDFSWLHFLFLLNVYMAVIGGVVYFAIHRTVPTLHAIQYAFKHYAGTTATLAVIGSSAFFFASQYAGSVVIPAVIASASPLVTSFAAHMFDRERITLYKRFGAFIVVVGLMLLNLL